MTHLRVLHVIPSVSISDGGPSKAIALIERVLSDRGIEVTTLTTRGFNDPLAPRSELRGGAASVRRIYVDRWVQFYKFAPGIVPYLLRNLRAFDVVHIHALFSFTSTATALVALWLRVPFIVRPLGTLTKYGVGQRRRLWKQLSIALFEKRILRGAAAVHFTSQAELEEAKSLGLRCLGIVIPLGVEEERPPEGQRSQATNIRADQKLILFLSRIDPKKNLEALIDAMALSEVLQKRCVLVVAGSGDPAYVESLKRRAASSGLADQIRWLGFVEGEDKAALLAAAHVFVLPSFSENFGIAAVEAMLAGVPCLLSPGIAIAAEAERAGAALVIEPTPDQIAAGIVSTLESDLSASSMGARGREFARRAYSTAAMGDALIHLYSDVRGRESELRQ